VLFVYAGPSLQLEVGMRRLRVRPT